MSKPPSPATEMAMHQVPQGATIISFCVPTRAFRIVDVKSDFKTLRVEQFIPHKGCKLPDITGNWEVRSTHSDKIAGGALRVAFDHAHKAQAKFIKMIRDKQAAAAEAHRKIMGALGAHNMPQAAK